MELKIQCACGQKYKFDIEPLRGQMPFPVNCPVCGLDGTAKANELIRQMPLSNQVPIGILATDSPAPSAIAPPPAREPAIAPVEKPRMRIGAIQPAALAPPSVPAAPARILAGQSRTAGGGAVEAKPAEKCRLLVGAGGAVVAGIVGMVGWYLLIKLTGYEFGFVAWAVGVLTGLGARLLGRAGSPWLGGIAATCAFLAVIGGEFLYASSEVDKFLDAAAEEAYSSRMEYARAAAAANSDEAIREVMVKYETTEDAPTADDVKTFREKELPELKDFANGKPGKAEYQLEIKGIKNTVGFKLLLLKESVGLFSLVWILLGISSAFKIAAD